jgi:NAD(P)-dependent dehydrogenase (short-subunit alcohol dehydrogenase family)
MRSQRGGTIVNVSSIGGKVWSLLGAWYQATKFALEGFSDCLRNELRPFGIRVVVVEPGAIKTEWGGTAVHNMLTVSAHGAYRELAQRAATVYQQADQQRGVAPDVIAHTILTAIRARHPKPRYVAPASARVIIFLRWLLSDQAFDRLMQRLFRVPQKL